MDRYTVARWRDTLTDALDLLYPEDMDAPEGTLLWGTDAEDAKRRDVTYREIEAMLDALATLERNVA